MTKSILIADDNEAIRRILREFFAPNPELKITEAVDGLDAIDKARALSPDLIILDVSMPRMNGLQAAKIIRAATQAPIILFTLYAEDIHTRDTVPFGINAVISKLDSADVLVAQIENLLNFASDEIYPLGSSV